MISVWKAIWTIMDAKRRKSTVRIYFYSGDELGSVLEAVNTATIQLKQILDGAVLSCRLTADVDLPFVSFEQPSDASPISDVEDGGLITFFDINRRTPFLMSLPTLTEDLYISGTNNIDLTGDSVLRDMILSMTVNGWTADAFPSASSVNIRDERLEFAERGVQVFKPRKYK